MICLNGINFNKAFLSSGTLNFFGQGWRHHRLYRILFPYFFGFKNATFIAKTTTLPPKKGNLALDRDLQPLKFFPECVRVYFAKGVALNAVSLSGPGAVALLSHGLWQKRKEPFFISYMPVAETLERRLEETGKFAALIRDRLHEFETAIGIKLNISCPNTKHDTTKLVKETLMHLTILNTILPDVPTVVKINILTNIETTYEIANSGLCSAIAVSNTIPWMQLPERIDWHGLFGTNISPLAKFGGGGLSGKPLLYLVAEYIRAIRQSGIRLPIIGGGGILCKKDAKIIKEAGADAIAFASAAILRPWRTQGIINYINNL